jgi:hypothetical protein
MSMFYNYSVLGKHHTSLFFNLFLTSLQTVGNIFWLALLAVYERSIMSSMGNLSANVFGACFLG